MLKTEKMLGHNLTNLNIQEQAREVLILSEVEIYLAHMMILDT